MSHVSDEEDGEFVDLVLSDVHLGTDSGIEGHHTLFHFHQPHESIIVPHVLHISYSNNQSSSFAYSIQLCVDEDGDLVPPRKRIKSKKNESAGNSIAISHKGATPLKDVGFQVWRGALILADFLVHHQSSSLLNSTYCIEIGCGVGLCGLVLARVAQRVFLTDYNDEILDNCMNNISLNEHLFRHKGSAKARRLDWKDESTWLNSDNTDSGSKYGWREDDKGDLQNAKLVIAADVIYDDELTDALFGALRVLLLGDKILLLALEKRLNFTIEELDVTAHAYSHFRDYLITDDPAVDWGPLSAIFGPHTTSNTPKNTGNTISVTVTSTTTATANNTEIDQTTRTKTETAETNNEMTKASAHMTSQTTNHTTSNTSNNNSPTTNKNTTTKYINNNTNENNSENNNERIEKIEKIEEIEKSEDINQMNEHTNNNNNLIHTRFHARPISIDFPQYFQYERVKELELWAIKLVTL